MKIVVTKNNIRAVIGFAELSAALARKNGMRELHRGVVDAGRKVKTRVQRSVNRQMALKPGKYQSYVVANTRGVPREAEMSYEIFSVKKGSQIEDYKGLMSVKSGGRAAMRMNAGRGAGEQGTVRSAVWNNPRVFKRSFEHNDNFYAFRPPSAGASSIAPKIFWTFGAKPNQPRGPGGRFASSGIKYGKVRRLFGPALSKEIPQGDSLATFHKEGPKLLEQAVSKRLAKLMRY